MYLIWSGWEGDYNGRQVIYIAKMKKPVDSTWQKSDDFKTRTRLGKIW